MQPSQPILQARGIELRRNGFALGPIDLKLESGFTALLGPNGAGKSTLLALLAGLLRPATGQVLLLDKPVPDYNRRALARELGFLPQQPDLPAGLTVAQTVARGRYARLQGLGFLCDDDRQALDRAMKAADLGDLAHRPMAALSGGERQRALLATVLAQEPRVLLLDEPDRGLDARHQSRLYSLLRDLAGQGLAVLAATHDMNLAAAAADRLILLDQGRLLRQGTAEEVLNQELLRQVYGHALTIARHPATQGPAVLPLTSCQNTNQNASQNTCSGDAA